MTYILDHILVNFWVKPGHPTVPAAYFLFAGTVPAAYSLFAGTLP